MPEGRGARKTGRGDGGRGVATRQSRRIQGLDPEFQRDVADVEREAREAKKAARGVAAARGEDTQVSLVQDQPAAEPPTQDDQDSSKEQGTAAANSGAELAGVQEELAREGGAQASVGGVDTVVFPEIVDLVSESSDESVVEMKPEAVRAMKEEGIQDSLVNSGAPVPVSRISAPSTAEALSPTPETVVKTEDKNPAQAGNDDLRLDGERAVMYVRREVTRWAETPSGRVVPPDVDFAWPTPRPDVDKYFDAVFATGDYLRWRMSLNSLDESWISELKPVRWGVGMAQDLVAIQIPPVMLTTRECIAILQTLLFEAGFEFHNVIPEWSSTQLSRIPEAFIRAVTGDMQACLGLELLEWSLVIKGIRFKVIPVPDTKLESKIQTRPTRLAYCGEDEHGDLLMTDYETELLGREFVLRFRDTGLRVTRSPRGSSEGEPSLKRTQLMPPWTLESSTPSALSTPSLSSLPVYMSSSSRSQSRTEIQSADDQNVGVQDSEVRDIVPAMLPSVIGTSGSSDESGTSGTMASHESSSSSSLMSFGRSASSHMPYSGAAALALIAQGGNSGLLPAGQSLGLRVTKTVLPPRPVTLPEQADVEMTETVQQDEEAAPRIPRPEVLDALAAIPSPTLNSGKRVSTQEPEDVHSELRSSRDDTKSRHSRKSRTPSESSRSSSRYSGSRSSVKSGPAQIELNMMRHQQEWQARMEQEQREFLARERLDALERERRREQRDLDARRQVQELTDQLVRAETTRLEAERRAQDLEARQIQSSQHTGTLHQDPAHVETLGRERPEAAYADHWQQREGKADAARAQRTENVQQDTVSEVEVLRKKVQEAEATMSRERESAQNLQNLQAGQLRDLRATLSQIQTLRATGDPHSATSRDPDQSPHPNSATMYPVSSVATGHVASVADLGKGMSSQKNISEVAAAQLRATLQRALPARSSSAAKQVKREHGTREAKAARGAQNTTVTTRKASISKTHGNSGGKRPPPGGSKNTVAKKSESRRDKHKNGGPPSDPGSSDGSDSDDSDSSGSDYGFEEEDDAEGAVSAVNKDGSTLLTFRPYINSTTLSEFDTKAELRDRVHWWEKFTNTAVQSGWSSKTRIQELKLKLSESSRDWFNQLPKHTQRDWKELASVFRKKYCKTRASNSERYFTMEMKSSETALEFFYRLNAAAGKADVDFRKSPTRLEKHIRRFITKLRDNRLKISLQGQHFSSISKLEAALEQSEDVWARGDQDIAPKNRDFRADNIPRGRFPPKRSGQAFVAQDANSGDINDEDAEQVSPTQSLPEGPKIPTMNSDFGNEIQDSDGGIPGFTGAEWTQTLTNEVYRVMDNMGWRPPPPSPGGNPGRREGSSWDKLCDKCGKWGHSEDNCWKDLKCERCQGVGHPTSRCRLEPCVNCGKLHQGKPCEDWRMLDAVKQLARQGALKELPSHILEKLLDGEANSGSPLNL